MTYLVASDTFLSVEALLDTNKSCVQAHLKFFFLKGECGLKVSNGHYDSSLLSCGIVKKRKRKKGFYLLNLNLLILYYIAKMSGKYQKK